MVVTLLVYLLGDGPALLSNNLQVTQKTAFQSINCLDSLDGPVPVHFLLQQAQSR